MGSKCVVKPHQPLLVPTLSPQTRVWMSTPLLVITLPPWASLAPVAKASQRYAGGSCYTARFWSTWSKVKGVRWNICASTSKNELRNHLSQGFGGSKAVPELVLRTWKRKESTEAQMVLRRVRLDQSCSYFRSISSGTAGFPFL